ncbi:GGDEF domain-containing protein [Rhizobium sp. LjRoot30]|uniref:GGDEF domain-containing protein n=1 Tax=Rhizobium sp. LjRoot30 TaxID=3342320 RepID=UPI003ED0C199
MKNALVAISKDGGATVSADAQKIMQVMARRGIAALPRNYELVFEALSGRNPELSADFAALGDQPRQAELDEMGFYHRLVGHCGVAAVKAQTETGALLRGLKEQLATGLSHKRTFLRALELTSRSLREDDTDIAETLASLDYLTAAMTEFVTVETALGKTLGDGAAALDKLTRGLGAVEKTMLIDKLTQLPNRIAFRKRLDSLYAEGSTPERTAVILADIDHFGLVNAKFGHQAGNRLLKRLASIFRKSVKKNDFVARIGGDDFAFVFSDVDQNDMKAISERLRGTIEENLVFATSDAGADATLTVSIGVALSASAPSAAQLQVNAEAALAAAKNNARHPIRFAV